MSLLETMARVFSFILPSLGTVNPVACIRQFRKAMENQVWRCDCDNLVVQSRYKLGISETAVRKAAKLGR